MKPEPQTGRTQRGALLRRRRKRQPSLGKRAAGQEEGVRCLLPSRPSSWSSVSRYKMLLQDTEARQPFLIQQRWETLLSFPGLGTSILSTEIPACRCDGYDTVTATLLQAAQRDVAAAAQRCIGLSARFSRLSLLRKIRNTQETRHLSGTQTAVTHRMAELLLAGLFFVGLFGVFFCLSPDRIQINNLKMTKPGSTWLSSSKGEYL